MARSVKTTRRRIEGRKAYLGPDVNARDPTGRASSRAKIVHLLLLSVSEKILAVLSLIEHRILSRKGVGVSFGRCRGVAQCSGEGGDVGRACTSFKGIVRLKDSVEYGLEGLKMERQNQNG